MNKTSRLHRDMKNYERECIKSALIATGFNKIKTAKFLGIGLSSLYRKIKELDIRR